MLVACVSVGSLRLMHQLHQMQRSKKKKTRKGGRRYDVARVGDHLGVTDSLLLPKLLYEGYCGDLTCLYCTFCLCLDR